MTNSKGKETGRYYDKRQRAKEAIAELQAWMLRYEVTLSPDEKFQVEGYELTVSCDYNGPRGEYRATISGCKDDYLFLEK